MAKNGKKIKNLAALFIFLSILIGCGDPIPMPSGDSSRFTSIAALAKWLSAQPGNTYTTPYKVALNVDNLAGGTNTPGSLGYVLTNNFTKYVSIDLSGSTITTIPVKAFYECYSLTSVTIPDSVTSIGNEAFLNCTYLTSVTFKGTIPSSGFSNDSNSPVFNGDLRTKFYEKNSTNGTPGTYTTTAPVSSNSIWTKQGNNDGEPVQVAFINVTSDGSESQTTTQLTLAFNKAIIGLAAADIDLTGITVTKGTLSGSGPAYTLPISGFTEGGTLNVSVTKSGYTISGSPKTAAVYYYGGTEKIVTLIKNDTYGSGWQAVYPENSLFSGKITQRDQYTLTYSFKSNVAMDYLQFVLIDNSAQGSGYRWVELSDYYIVNENITANTVYSGTITIAAAGTAADATDRANRLVLQAGDGTKSSPTLTFTTLSVVKTKDDNITLTNNGTYGWQAIYTGKSLFSGKITQWDQYILTYSFKSNVAMDYLQFVLIDNSAQSGYGWVELSDYYKVKENITANTVYSGTITITAAKTAADTTAQANRLVLQAGTGTKSSPTLTFTTLSVAKK